MYTTGTRGGTRPQGGGVEGCATTGANDNNISAETMRHRCMSNQKDTQTRKIWHQPASGHDVAGLRSQLEPSQGRLEIHPS